MIDYDIHPCLGRITVPTLVFYGASEPAADLSLPGLLQHLPQVHPVEIENRGHLPFIEQPEVFLKEVRAFQTLAVRGDSSRSGN